MSVTVSQPLDRAAEAGRQMYALIEDLFPICRSITGNGLRETLRRLQKLIPLEIHEVPSGTAAFDWIVPREWNIRDAYVKNSRGERVIDFQKNNLHVVNYSIPFRGNLSLQELKNHLHSIPERPDWIPYRTTYYKESWGFCLSHREFERLAEGDYEVCIDSSLEAGSLNYGEMVLPGAIPDEILISCHTCHPSLANDNLSGLALAVWLARKLREGPRQYTYRFLFIPGTIGSIAWLSCHESLFPVIRHGLVLAGVGDKGPFTYKRSRQGIAEIDRAAVLALAHSGKKHQVIDFSPYGYDERQYCSPGINLAVGRFSRTPHGTFPEYHTSADNLDFVSAESLAESFEICTSILSILENNATFLNLSPKGEPQLGRRGLYRAIGGAADPGTVELALQWVLNLSDGSHSLLEIAERSGMHFDSIHHAARLLADHGLLKNCTDRPSAFIADGLGGKKR